MDQHTLMVNGRVVGTFPSKEEAEKARKRLPLQEQAQATVAKLLVE